MKLTQRTITDFGILVLGLITVIILVRSWRPPTLPSPPPILENIKRLIDATTDPIASYKAGKDFAQKGQLLEAAASFKKATQLDGHWRDAYVALGQTYLALDESKMPNTPGDLTWLQKAEFALRRAQKLDPLYQPTYEQLATVYQRTGESEKLAEIKSTLNSLMD